MAGLGVFKGVKQPNHSSGHLRIDAPHCCIASTYCCKEMWVHKQGYYWKLDGIVQVGLGSELTQLQTLLQSARPLDRARPSDLKLWKPRQRSAYMSNYYVTITTPHLPDLFLCLSFTIWPQIA